ncbi:restriction endonuclease EcoRII, partial [Cupriavidus sp. HMR-1]|uniref:restriction endonuclease EcoRII n=1 Tax=Cupriavidus sp. HMR-1 TaxID=1249621 RepID=UPI0002A3C2F4
MPEQLDIFSEKESNLPVSAFIDSSEAIFVKKLSLNDRDWSRLPNKHQAGVYVPPSERDSGFFPPLVTKRREKPDADEIRETFFEIEWIGINVKKQARLAHYTSKRAETHLTRLPKAAFCDLAPASFLVIGRRGADAYRAVTIDSESDDCDLLGDLLSLPPDFRSGVFALEALRRKREEKELTFIEEVVKAFFAGTIDTLAAKYASMPATAALAATARARYMADNGLKSLDPYSMARPGDAIRAISRGVEYEIFKEFQMRARAVCISSFR